MENTLLTTNIKTIIANKWYIPISAWESLPKSAKESIKSLYIQKTNNPYNCFIHTANRKCQLKDAMIEAGKKPIIACFNCSRSEDKVSCISKSGNYIKLGTGSTEAGSKVLGIFKQHGMILEFEDRRVFPRIENKWDMEYSKLDEEKSREQRRLADLWIGEKKGILIAAPRFGKTLMCANVAARARTRVLVLVHKVDLANQFYKDWTEFTTIDNSRIKVNPKIEEMENLDVCLCTYQQFVGKYGEARLEKAKKLFGLIIVDEVHKASADKFHDVINSFWAKYRLAVTATPERRDNKQFRNEHTFGPVLAQGGAEQLSCDYIFTETNWTIPYNMSGDRAWTLLWGKLAKDEDRNELIAKYAIRDVLDNYKIMIPVKRHDHIKLLHDMINKLAKKEGILVSVCEYHGNLNKQVRNKLQEEIYQGKYDVVIGMDSIISLGFNAPPMSCIYINVHTYRTFAPDLYQEFSRVRTKFRNGKKNKPLIRIFKDIGEQSDKSIAMISKEMVKYGFSEIPDTFSERKIVEKSKRGLTKFM